ncbi:MAG: hypothetical protein LBH04_05835 [Tannerellaceae bacterium]|nr:hypothetical protein [Tannerellaceae bacterium]
MPNDQNKGKSNFRSSAQPFDADARTDFLAPRRKGIPKSKTKSLKSIKQDKMQTTYTKFHAATYLLILFIAAAPARMFSQTTIGSDAQPAKAAILELKTQSAANPPGATDKLNVTTSKGGLVLPRVKLTSLTTMEPFIPATDPEWVNNTASRVKELHAGLMVYNLTTGDLLKPGIYIWNGSRWMPAHADVPGAANGLTLSGDTFTLGGKLTAATNINLNGQTLNFTGNDSIHIAAPLRIAGKWNYMPSAAKEGMFLISDDDGNATWEGEEDLPPTPSAIFNPNGVTFDISTMTGENSWINTNTWIEIPPGRWFVAVTMHTSITKANPNINDWYWVRSTFLKDGSSAEESKAYYEGKSHLISGRIYNGDSVISGYVIIKNPTQSNLKFNYYAGWTEVHAVNANSTATLNKFGSPTWKESAIIAFALSE